MRIIFNLAILCCFLMASQTTQAQQFDEADFKRKSQLIIAQTADKYAPPPKTIGDPEKYYWPKAMARFEKYGLSDTAANNWIAQFAPHPPFHFTLVGMARIYAQYAKAPAMQANRLRYLQEVFKRNDSYNAWVSEGTENHNSMSRTSAYLYSQYAAAQFPQEFPNAKAKLLEAEDWLRWWANNLYSMGNGEWNTNIYETYNMLGWFNLYDYAQDPAIKDLARAVLDYYACELALNYSYGLLGGPEMRGNGIGQSGGSGATYLCWLWYAPAGAPQPEWSKGEYIQSMHPITSSYRPPHLAVALAQKKLTVPAVYHNTRPSYVQSRPALIKQVFSINPTFTLGTAMNPYTGFTGTTYQMVNWKLVAKPVKASVYPFEVSGNGRYYEDRTGKTRNPFTQHVQHDNVLVQLTKTPLNADSIVAATDKSIDKWNELWARDFTQRFPSETYKRNHVNRGGKRSLLNESYINLPADVTVKQVGTVYFADLEQTWLAIYPIGKVSLEKPKAGEDRGRQYITTQAPRGEICGFVVEAASTDKYPTFADFIRASTSRIRLNTSALAKNSLTYQSLTNQQLGVTFADKGFSTDALVDWGYGPTKPEPRATEPAFQQPEWPKGNGSGRMASLTVNGKPVNYDQWKAVFEGPDLQLADKVLELRGPGTVYQVDFSKRNPTFLSK